jgi:hypothetical protein
VEIEGDELEIKKLLEQGKKPTQWNKKSDFSIENFIPTPSNIQDSNDWHIAHWGTKWDIEPVIDNQGSFVQMEFDSAWSPPSEAFDQISKLYPDLKFKFSYFEPGNDFCGVSTYLNGLKDSQEFSYRNRFNFELSLDFQNFEIENGIISIPLSMIYYENEYDFESQKVSILCNLSLPDNIEKDEVESKMFSYIKIVSDDNIEQVLKDKEYYIIEFITENLPALKKAVESHELDQSLPINASNKIPSKKL